MSIRPARVRAIVVAVLVLAFVIPWTYAHIAYSWDWKEKTEGDACTGKYYLTPYDKQRSIFLGVLSDGRKVRMGSRGEVSMGREIASFGISATSDGKSYDLLGRAKGLHRATAPPSRGRHFHLEGSPLRHRVVHANLESTVLL